MDGDGAMKAQLYGVVATASLLGLGALFWWPSAPATRQRARASVVESAPVAASVEVAPRVAPPVLALASPEIETHPHPHPLTPAHARLRRERSLITRLDAAVDARRGDELRQALDQYRREFPGDEQRLQDGYTVLAACLEHPDGAAHDAAQRFYDERRGSSLRRWVRRICLES